MKTDLSVVSAKTAAHSAWSECFRHFIKENVPAGQTGIDMGPDSV